MTENVLIFSAMGNENVSRVTRYSKDFIRVTAWYAKVKYQLTFSSVFWQSLFLRNLEFILSLSKDQEKFQKRSLPNLFS